MSNQQTPDHAAKPNVQRILFLCYYNSSRSKMAQGYLEQLGVGRYITESAGTVIGKLTNVELEVMQEAHLRTDYPTNTVFTFFNSGKTFDHVISICNTASEECSSYPGKSSLTVWVFEDPATFKGTRPQRLAKTREVRDGIKRKVQAFLTGHAAIA